MWNSQSLFKLNNRSSSNRYLSSKMVPQLLLLNQKDKIIQQSQKTQGKKNVEELMYSKESASTKHSLSNVGAPKLEQTVDSMLDFTFNEFESTTIPSFTQQQNFQSRNVETIVLYAFLYNHIHLEREPPKWNKISNKNRRIVQIIKSIFIESEDQINSENKLGNFSAIQFIQVLHFSSGTIDQRLIRLKKIMKNLDFDSIQLIFWKVIKRLQRSKEEVNSHKDKENRRSCLKQSPQYSLRQLAQVFKVKFNLQQEKQILSFGSKENTIEISIKKRSSSKRFFLKSIACSEVYS